MGFLGFEGLALGFGFGGGGFFGGAGGRGFGFGLGLEGGFFFRLQAGFFGFLGGFLVGFGFFLGGFFFGEFPLAGGTVGGDLFFAGDVGGRDEFFFLGEEEPDEGADQDDAGDGAERDQPLGLGREAAGDVLAGLEVVPALGAEDGVGRGLGPALGAGFAGAVEVGGVVDDVEVGAVGGFGGGFGFGGVAHGEAPVRWVGWLGGLLVCNQPMASSSLATRASRVMRSWVMESRSRRVTVPSSRVWKSTVTHQGVPASSMRR